MRKAAIVLLAASLATGSATAAFAFAGTATPAAAPARTDVVEVRVDDFPPYNWQMRRGERNWHSDRNYRRDYDRRDYDRRDYRYHRDDRAWERDRYRYRRSNGFYFGFGFPRW